MTNDYNRLSDRERLEAGHTAPCAICGRVIQPAQPYQIIPGQVIRLVHQIADLPAGVYPTPQEAVICRFCAEGPRDQTNDFRRADKASAYENALELARHLPDLVLDGQVEGVSALEQVQNKVQATYPNLLILHAGQVSAKALRVERGRRRTFQAIGTQKEE